MARVLGVLAGRDMPPEHLERWAKWAEVILAADAGADRLAELEVQPDLVIGDFDSIEADHDGVERVPSPGQDDTDCDKLLLHAIAMGHESITLACIEGDQLDHMLSTLYSAAKHPIQVRIALRSGVGWVLTAPFEGSFATTIDRRVSLMPLGHCEGVSIEGVEWPLIDVELTPLGQISIGNRAIQSEIKVKIGSGAACLFLESSRTDPIDERT